MSVLVLAKILGLFFITALAEIIGCYLPYLWLKQSGSPWLLVPAVLSLVAFVWLLTLHPAESGRVYAAYGGIYVLTALAWLKWVDGVSWSAYDAVGGIFLLTGMAVIAVGWAHN